MFDDWPDNSPAPPTVPLRTTAVRELIEAYDEYIALLVQAEKDLSGLAYAHGYRCPDELVKRGEELRAKIADLKSKLYGTELRDRAPNR